MWGRLIALSLIVALGATLAAGAALPHEEHSCPMQGMMDGAMDCCALAELQSDAPEVLTARLCCAINCPQPAPPGRQMQAPRAPQTAEAPRPSVAQALRHVPDASARFVRFKLPAANSPPAYIQHAALLI
jgi:hypothetical protein